MHMQGKQFHFLENTFYSYASFYTVLRHSEVTTLKSNLCSLQFDLNNEVITDVVISCGQMHESPERHPALYAYATVNDCCGY